MDENLKELLEDVIEKLAKCAAYMKHPASLYYCTVAARQVKDAFDACKEALEKINAP